eukprot:TRINITY_DN23470_c0_g1_i1.p3 TRINITY_DN23470_c0_g1~~TRINITY_DN23470_c0_g1_i1.p3  ORF type:complete len:164 (+),score=32.56 TRINITY_DN23470_c0_g1_i1:72-563(+)
MPLSSEWDGEPVPTLDERSFLWHAMQLVGDHPQGCLCFLTGQVGISQVPAATRQPQLRHGLRPRLRAGLQPWLRPEPLPTAPVPQEGEAAKVATELTCPQPSASSGPLRDNGRSNGVEHGSGKGLSSLTVRQLSDVFVRNCRAGRATAQEQEGRQACPRPAEG